jgi:hypothetical protein
MDQTCEKYRLNKIRTKNQKAYPPMTPMAPITCGKALISLHYASSLTFLGEMWQEEGGEG